MRNSLLFLTAGVALAWTELLAAAPPVDYLRDVKPILESRCFACHGALKQEASLRLDTAALARKGGDSGPAVEPGAPEASPLIERISEEDADFRMPPEGKPLTAEQIQILTAWITAGAPAPADEQPQPDPRQHWSFQPPVRPNVPPVADPAWVRNPIDGFIAAEHQRRGLAPNPTAAKPALLRRVYLDLIGLPPTREELRAFLDDTSDDAYEKVVDRLLASPQYGERWGRHWMDVWRYSDWYGRRNVNDVRNSDAQIWRWRDWIVNSLNADKGYDRMVVEMLAADEIAPDDDAAIVATGYIVRNWYSLNYNAWMKDLVEHTGKAFLAMRLNCAHCHDHKYDPVSQEEYFRFRAFFEPLEIRRDRVAGEADPGPFKPYIYASSTAPITTGMIRVLDNTLDAETYMYHLGDSRNRMKDVPPTPPGAPAILGGDRLTVETVSLPPVAFYPGLKPFIQQDAVAQAAAAIDKAQQELDNARSEIDAQGNDPLRRQKLLAAQSGLAAAEAKLLATKAAIAADEIRYRGAAGNADAAAQTAVRAERAAAILVAREQQNRAAVAQATAADDKARAAATEQIAAADKALTAALEAAVKDAGGEYTPLSPTYHQQSTGRRSALAKWIADERNPRTARVAVNHMWLRHFGAPLVPTVTDFGVSGEPPTHPQLLDWLAVELTEHDWRMKHLHRLIVTSNTYRMAASAGSTDVAKANRNRDPDNVRLWHFPSRRVESEVIRDSVLYLAGELDLTMGGRPIETAEAVKSKRRSLYFSRHPEAGGVTPFLAQFDPPDPIDCYLRTESIVPQQALAMTNSDLFLAGSKELTSKLTAGGEDFVTAAYEHLLSRTPTEEERTSCADFLAQQQQLYLESGTQEAATEAARLQRARESLIRVLLNHHDFVVIP